MVGSQGPVPLIGSKTLRAGSRLRFIRQLVRRVTNSRGPGVCLGLTRRVCFGALAFFTVFAPARRLAVASEAPVNALPAPIPTSADDHWAPGFHFQGTSGDVRSFAVYRDRLVLGGLFYGAGSVLANGIVAWNGHEWSLLGSGVGDDIVSALLVLGDTLIAGGSFTSAGGEPAQAIAAWNGNSWMQLGSGMDGRVLALAEYNGDLVAGGDFTEAGGVAARNIALWDGQAWRALSSVGNGTVQALAVYNGELIAAGEFTQIGGVSANHIAAWDGASWRPLANSFGNGVDGGVYALAVYQGSLIVGGMFNFYPGQLAKGIVRWDGTSWSRLSEGIGGYTLTWVHALGVAPDGALIAGGTFRTIGGVAAECIARWDGQAWSALGAGFFYPSPFPPPIVYAIIAYQGSLFAGGQIGYSAGFRVQRVARWDGALWQPIDPGLGFGGPLYAFTLHEGDLIAGGFFDQAGTVPANGVARFNGTTWQALDTGISSPVLALVSTGRELIAGGGFYKAGGTDAICVARWDGVAWHPMDAGLDSLVYALTLFKGDVIAGGKFTHSGTNPVRGVARWDGSTWQPLGSGVDLGQGVASLTVYDEALVTGGFFSSIGGIQASNIARWDGNTWSGLGEGIDGPVMALGIYQGDLIAAGRFSWAGASHARSIARWDGTSWGPLGDIPYANDVNAVAVLNNDLFATGWFGRPETGRNIVRWNGASWLPLGSGLSSIGRTLASFHGSLFVGGNFALAGNKPSSGIARWDSVPVPVEISDFRAAANDGVVVLRWSLTGDQPHRLIGIRVQRSEDRAGPFSDRTPTPLVPDDSMTFQDSTDAGTFWYRLLLLYDPASVIVGPIRVDVAPGQMKTGVTSVRAMSDGLVELRYAIGSRSPMDLSIFDVRGRLVRNLRKGQSGPGEYVVRWDRKSDAGSRTSRGVYIVRLAAGGITESQKIVLVGP